MSLGKRRNFLTIPILGPHELTRSRGGPALVAVCIALSLAMCARVAAQAGHAGHASHAEMTDSSDQMAMQMPQRPFGIPMTRMGSGTAWLPDASGMRAWHYSAGPWMLMLHGDVFLQWDHQGGPRGADQIGSINWGMLMAMRPLAGGTLHLHGMVSAEPLTIADGGYPLLLQTGETYRGEPLHDRQHPHDLFMELSAMYERALTNRIGFMMYVAPVGEPAIGPVAYMHRPSALNDPFAPLSHHWTDATHITYGVLTAGLFTRALKLEGTLFNGREPDEDRYDFDFHGSSSYGFRLSANPAPNWALAASYGSLEGPEAVHPDENQRRIAASVLHTVPFGRGGEWATAIVYGALQHRNASTGEASDWLHSVSLESNFQLDRSNSVFARLEYVTKTGEDLVISGAEEQEFDVSSLSLSYVRELSDVKGASFGAGLRGAVNFLPRSLEADYDDRSPMGMVLFFRVRPALIMEPHAMEMKMEMQPGEGPDNMTRHGKW